VIFNATTNEYEVYDLIRDPRETTNLAIRSPDLTVNVPQHIAAWVQYQSRLMQRLLSSNASPAAGSGSRPPVAARGRPLP
jgi:hypothetical protein